MTKKILAKITSIIILVSAFIDTNLEVLHGIGLDDLTINWIKMVGLVIAAVLPGLSFTSKPKFLNEDEDIAGGGPKNPPKIQ